MNEEMVPRWRVEAERLADHIRQDERRFAKIEERLERIEGHILALLQFRWQLMGALALAVFLATLLAGWLR